jgi:myo-inositol-1(or 4)-monophosphatase
MLDLPNLLNVAKDAAVIAGNYLKESQNEDLQILLNSGRDVKLQIDQDTEELIKKEISARSDLPILGEESGYSEDLGDIFWVIDPLDGTSNYLRNIPISCVAIAVIHKLNPVVGVINDFNNNHLYYAHEGMPAYMNNKNLNVSLVKSKADGTLVTGIPAKTHYSNEEFHTMITEFQEWKKIRMIGSAAMASAYVAAGKADTYKENGIFLWDVAAGAAIVKSAGGNISISDIQDDFRVNAKFSNFIIED